MTSVYQEFRPSSRLEEHVECFWSLEAAADTRQLVVPDGCMDILLRMHKDVYAIDVIGSMTRTEQATIRSGHTYLGVRFRPGRLREIALVDCSKLVNGAEPLQNVLNINISQFSECISRASAKEEKIELLERVLTIKSDPLSGQRAIEALVVEEGNISATELADIAELSQRQLRRQCILLTGMPPKVLACVLRFRKAYRTLQSEPRTGLAEIALDCGYFDQAHFAHDFARFAGSAPSSYAKKMG